MIAPGPGILYRGIAQSGSAPALGAGCREFESLYPDQFSTAALVLERLIGDQALKDLRVEL